MNRCIYRLFVLSVFFSAFAVPTILGSFMVPLGEGPDEIAHIENSFFRLARPSQTINVERGLYEPGQAPVGQGHQAPLYYKLNSWLLAFFHKSNEVGPFVDYLAGVHYSSEGLFFGGQHQCSYREPDWLTRSGPHYIYSLSSHILRWGSAFLFLISGVAAYLLGLELFPNKRWFALALTLLYFSIPNAIWRSIFVSNDNLVSCLGAWCTYFIALVISRRGKSALVALLASTLLAALAFLTKYNAAPLLLTTAIAIFLNVSWSLLSKIGLAILSSCSMLALIAPVLYRNYIVDGDILSKSVIIHVAPFLYKPISLWALITDRYFFLALLERIWVEFHAILKASPYFPRSILLVWVAILLTGFVGIFATFMDRKILAQRKRLLFIFLFLFICTLGAVFQFATSFPMPAGRYVHPALLALCAALLIGHQALCNLLYSAKNSPRVLLSSMFVIFIFGQGLTFGFMFLKYKSCAYETRYNVAGGVSISALDMDGDGRDELQFFHRTANRVFYAKETKKGKWKLLPKETRSFGLVADIPLAADVSGDTRSEIIMWRPGMSLLAVADAKYFLNYDVSASQYRDLAVRFAYVFYPAAKTDRAFMCKEDGKTSGQILFFDENTHGWLVSELTLTKDTELQAVPPQPVDLPGSYDVPLVTMVGGHCYLAGFNSKTSKLYLRSLNALGPTSEITIAASENIIFADLNSDSIPEIVGWSNNTQCLVVTLLQIANDGDIRDSLQTKLCGGLIPNFSTDDRLIALGQRSKSILADFSQATGKVVFLHLGIDQNSQLSLDHANTFNPGWANKE